MRLTADAGRSQDTHSLLLALLVLEGEFGKGLSRELLDLLVLDTQLLEGLCDLLCLLVLGHQHHADLELLIRQNLLDRGLLCDGVSRSLLRGLRGGGGGGGCRLDRCFRAHPRLLFVFLLFSSFLFHQPNKNTRAHNTRCQSLRSFSQPCNPAERRLSQRSTLVLNSVVVSFSMPRRSAKRPTNKW